MNRLRFENQGSLGPSAPNRVDIACFIGFVPRRDTQVPAELVRFLRDRGFMDPQANELVEVVATVPLPDTVHLPADTQPLRIDIDGRFREVRLPTGDHAPQAIVSWINRNLAGGYARLVGGALALGTDSRRLGSIQVAVHPQLGFSAPAQADADDAIAEDVSLDDVPIPIESWDFFDYLFDWQHRPLDENGAIATTYLGAAVRSFFALGGRKCYVVRVGDPWTIDVSKPVVEDAAIERERLIVERASKLIPGFPISVNVSPVDRKSWHGIGHVYGLPDVTFVCFPDLTDIVADPMRMRDARETQVSVLPERFVDCSAPQPIELQEETEARLLEAPRCDATGYANWTRAINLVGQMLARTRREMQLIAAIPIPDDQQGADRSPMELLQDGGRGPLGESLRANPRGISSAFVQLVYPWVRSPGSRNLPQQLEPPEGVLAGLLARNALSQGTFRSAANLHLADVHAVAPELTREQMEAVNQGTGRSMLERVSLLGETPAGLRLLSDVTTSLQGSVRLASVNRLIASITRAARRLGEQVVFDSSGGRLWTQIRQQMHELLLGLYQAGALQGENSGAAFHVRCDRGTMSQNDIDNGRVIAELRIHPTANIEQIIVTLAMEEGGLVSLAPRVASSTEAA